MLLPGLRNFFTMAPLYREKDSNNLEMRCLICGGSKSNTSARQLSIKLPEDKKEPVLYNCYRASCPSNRNGRSGGILTPEVLTKQMRCMDAETSMELAKHNKGIKWIKNSKGIIREKKGYTTFNLNNQRNKSKLEYLNKRLGWSLQTSDLKKLKIQLSLYDFLQINNIKKVPFPPNVMDMIDRYCIGFISAFDDYIIFRDISPNNILGQRYITYRINEKNTHETKIYIHPGEIDLLSPEPATITVAEGIISLFGGIYNNDLNINTPNKVFAANCGSHFTHTISSICVQYGLTNIVLNILSDSEVKRRFYDKLYRQIKDDIDIQEMIVHYNRKREDFGHRQSYIQPKRLTISSNRLYL